MSFILLGFFSFEINAEEKGFCLRLLGRYTSPQLFRGTVPMLPYTNPRSSVGFSEKAMAQYIYGPESISCADYASLGINGVIPHVPREGIIMLNLTCNWVLQGINKNADFIRGDDQNDVFYLNFFKMLSNCSLLFPVKDYFFLS